jgi:hypothetical protein
LTSDGSLYKSVYSSGVTGVPTSQTALPDIIILNYLDSGNLWALNNDNGTSDTVIWLLTDDPKGHLALTFSAVSRNANTVIRLEDTTFYLDSNGNPTRESLTLAVSGLTLALSGNRD